MGQKIAAFCASPRHRSNSEILADHILKGAEEAGALVEKVRLHDLSIHPCTGCDECRETIEAPCVLHDDMPHLLQKVRAANGFVFASPIYSFCVNAQMKVFFDRLYALGGGGTTRGTLRGKRAVVALTYGDADPLASGAVNALGMFQYASTYHGFELMGWVHASCKVQGEVEINRNVLEKAIALGHKLGA
jgi:multimeric flavodoxin WrbA